MSRFHTSDQEECRQGSSVKSEPRSGLICIEKRLLELSNYLIVFPPVVSIAGG